MKNLKEMYIKACESVVHGDYPDALEAFLWLHDNPAPDDPSSEIFRRAFGFQAWAQLGRKFPLATEKMRELLAHKISLVENNLASKAIESDVRAMKAALAALETSGDDCPER